MQDTYAKTTTPYVDSHIIVTLFRSELIAHLHKVGSGITDDWICPHVVPNMVLSGLPVPLCTMFGCAGMLKVFEKAIGDKALLHCIPGLMVGRTMSPYCYLSNCCGLGEQENWIARLALGI